MKMLAVKFCSRSSLFLSNFLHRPSSFVIKNTCSLRGNSFHKIHLRTIYSSTFLNKVEFGDKDSSIFSYRCTQIRNFTRFPFKLRKDSKNETKVSDEDDPPKKLSLVQRYKKMLKEYWYVAIPVHMITSTVWFGIFYYLAKSGIDIVPLLEQLNFPESIIKPLRNSSLGHIAVASAMYKLATPARYMVTLGGTTVTIKELTKRGLIKPVPSKDKFKTLIKEKLQSKKKDVSKDDT